MRGLVIMCSYPNIRTYSNSSLIYEFIYIFRCVGSSIDIHVSGNRQTYKMIVIYIVCIQYYTHYVCIYTYTLISLLGMSVYPCMPLLPKIV